LCHRRKNLNKHFSNRKREEKGRGAEQPVRATLLELGADGAAGLEAVCAAGVL
jgi:hypothetical protein